MQKTGGLKVDAPRDGRKMGRDDSNIAVVEPESLATEPLRLRLDRAGKTVLEGEAVEAAAPWSVKDIQGQSSAAAPLSWEEFEARYRCMDKTMERTLGPSALKEIRTHITSMDGKDNYRTVRTYSWPREDGGTSAVMLVGVTETSARSRRLAARAVYEAEPSALLVQLCRERVGRHLVMPEEHLAAVASYARGYALGNPHRLREEIFFVDVVNGDFEALALWMKDLAYTAAVEEFAQSPRGEDDLPKVLCLGDVRTSRLEWVRKQYGNETLREVSALSARGKQLARGLIALASLGHKAVLGVVDIDMMPTVSNWLERAGAKLQTVADAADIESGRESMSADMRTALRASAPLKRGRAAVAAATLGFGNSRLGAFLNEEGMAILQRRKRRLAKLNRVKDLVRHCEPPKVWKVAELLGGEGPTPGPGALLKPATGLRFELGRLEIPVHYLRDAGMEAFAPELWRSLCDRGAAVETKDLTELTWWAAGATEASGGGASDAEDGEGEAGDGDGGGLDWPGAPPGGW